MMCWAGAVLATDLPWSDGDVKKFTLALPGGVPLLPAPRLPDFLLR